MRRVPSVVPMESLVTMIPVLATVGIVRFGRRGAALAVSVTALVVVILGPPLSVPLF